MLFFTVEFRSQTSGNNSVDVNSFNSSVNRSFPPFIANTSNISSSLSTHDSSHDMIIDQEKPKMFEMGSSFNGPKGDISDTNHAIMTEHKEQGCKDDFVFHPPDQTRVPARRLRVSDINVSRYEEEFVEIEELASGVFGKVMVARHRLDGMVYAIKVKNNNSMKWFASIVKLHT